MDEIVLIHHGTKGMRWGVRRYQNKDGSLTAAGKKRRDKLQAEEDRKAEKQAKYEADKQKAIRTGSAKEVLKYKNDLTPQERRTIEERIRWEKSMSEMASKEVPAGKARVDKFFKGVDDASNKAKTAINFYNTAASVYNAFNKKGNKLPKIDMNVNGNEKNSKKTKKFFEDVAEDFAKEQQKRADKEARAQEKAERKAEKKAKKEKVYTGTVEGEGTSRRTKSEKRGRDYYDDIIDAEWRDVSSSSVPATRRSSGEAYVATLLEDKR